ncbi:MAG: hypothetical protein DPW18_00535 [Chloroflexi bacterium]|nr:hypothetical protein [Chloroflexota bacterium]MDL1941296.1 hypothetical protein [Chloroflexi bacterium CFX2]
MSEETEFDVEKHVAYWRDGALETWKDVVHKMNIETRSPGIFGRLPSKEEAQAIVERTKVVWNG